MAITNYTFFSPNGDDFPVTANADAKLYMMLSGMPYNSAKVKHWTNPINTALNRVYVNTSVVVGGRYFELENHSVTVLPSTTNYVHANIDLSTPLEPVTITVESADNSNTVDINNNSGVLKRVIDIITTNSSAITNATLKDEVLSFGNVTVKNLTVSNIATTNVTGFYTLTLTFRRIGNDVELISTRTTISGANGHEQTDAGFTIPIGFRPISRALAKVEMNNNTTLYNPMILRLDSDGKVYLTNEAFTNNRYAQCYATWKTTDPWPS